MRPVADDVREKDKVAFEVLSGETSDDGRIRLSVSLRHKDYRPDRFWSHCELEVFLPAGADPPPVPCRARLVFTARAARAGDSDAPGAYSCRVSASDQAPLCLPERPGDDGLFIGLTERGDPPDEGEVIFHMGSGVTCYVEMPEDFDGAEPESSQWWQFAFPDGLEVLVMEVL